MSLYLKYRPNTLEEVKGNVDIVSALESMLSNKETCPHAFLLHGSTGCGKTTIARIIANRLGCVGTDYKEYNASDDTGVDGVREIIKNSQFRPLEGPCRVWVIDECQRWTGNAQDSVLKILEDSPKHIYFILCTTEPNKLKSTIKGRCQQFQVKPLSDNQLLGLLRRVVREENETCDKVVLDQIVINSKGHPRNALQILEQVLNVTAEKRLDIATRAEVEQTQSIELCRALLRGAHWKEIAFILNGLMGQEPEEIRRHILGYCQSVLLKEDNIRCGLIMEEMFEPFYNTNFPGLVYKCYTITKNQ